MGLPAFRLATAPVFRGKIVSLADSWPGGAAKPTLTGEPNLPIPSYSLLVSPYGTSGSYGSYFRYFWRDLVAYPSGTPTEWILYGEHDCNDRWDGVSGFLVGFGVAVHLPTGVDFTSGTPSYAWTFRGARRIDTAHAEMDLTQTDGSNPLVVVSGTGQPKVIGVNRGGEEIACPWGGLGLSFQSPLLAGLRGNLSLQEALRREMVFLPEFDDSTLLSLPLVRTTEPEIGVPPDARASSGSILTCPRAEGTRDAASARLPGDRADRSAPLFGMVVEADTDNAFDYSSPLTAAVHGMGTLPTGSGNDTNVGFLQDGDFPGDRYGIISWRKGTTSAKLTRTFTAIAVAGETWCFSAWVRGAGRSASTVSIAISGSPTTGQSIAQPNEWTRVYAYGTQSSANVTVSIDQGNEGDVIEVTDYQLEKVSNESVSGAPSSFIPDSDALQGSRSTGTLRIRQPVYGQEGTLIVVFRFPDRGGEKSLVPIVGLWDSTASAYTRAIALTAYPGTTENRRIGFYHDEGTPAFEYAEIPLAIGSVVHLGIRWEHLTVSGTSRLTLRYWINGVPYGNTYNLSVAGSPGKLGDEIHIAPSADLPSYGSPAEEMTPFAGTIELVRYDARAWADAELPAHGTLWTTDTGRDLLYLALNRRYRARGPYAPIPGSEKYLLSDLALSQIGSIPTPLPPEMRFRTETQTTMRTEPGSGVVPSEGEE